MMQSNQIRNIFLEFFQEKGHKIVPSAPIVLKNDPTLMFTNAGMNQFKDYFLGNKTTQFKRITDTQKCLRVTGKHNDLEDVGIDTYHHTMFEMLGNWSFGDYFKKDAINWAWELLTERYKIPKDRIYVTYFEGSDADNVPPDSETVEIWKKHLAEDRILAFGKKDNFWEMGATGPCGPCSEIHVDLRSEAEREAEPAQLWVNKDHPQVIEIWNNVFIQYNRNEDGSLKLLPDKHVDTGMGLERLCRVLQNKSSNYDTDLFMPMIQLIESDLKIGYGKSEKIDIAIRVIVDHIRAVTFAIADGQLPSNTGAGYVIRRILRRAVRYGYSALGLEEPYIFRLIPVLAKIFSDIFPEIIKQEDFIKKVVQEEEAAFLRTLAAGNKMFERYVSELTGDTISGKFAFELYDTFGFPFDLTQLMAREKGLLVEEDSFEAELLIQKNRSRKATEREEGDWHIVHAAGGITEFLGYDQTEAEVKILRYRKVVQKQKVLFHLILDKTPFYPEGGGQIGDTGILIAGDDCSDIVNTFRENEQIIHVTNELPINTSLIFHARVDVMKRDNTARNHSATHLLHAALRKVLGKHVVQKGSLVHDKALRFDFAHFSKVSEEEIAEVEKIVNAKIRENIILQEERNLPFNEAVNKGAMALFGEKYGESVRVITFDPAYSVELCGGIHVKATGSLGYFKIVSESAVAAGVRRIEAITGAAAEQYINEHLKTLQALNHMLKHPKELIVATDALLKQNKELSYELEKLQLEQLKTLRDSIVAKSFSIKENINILAEVVELSNSETGKTLAFELKNMLPDTIIIIGSGKEDKANIWLSIPENMITTWNLNAGKIIREISADIEGGGGGQAFFASAGGKKPSGLQSAIRKAVELINAQLN